MSATTAPVTPNFRMIPLAHITPSPMNPRKRFDEKPLKELAESIKTHGVRQPVLVRPDGKTDRFELVVGERRWRASKLAGKTEIPAVIDHLSNSEALEIMVIENLQREDVHPLDEALGYEALMRKSSEVDPELGELPGAPRHTAESIAAKVGKSVGYVYARLKLLALVPAARDAFEHDHITPGHAVLIARLQPFDQLKALAACFKNYVTADEDSRIKKLDATKASWDDLAEEINIAVADDALEIPEELRLASEKYLRNWIQEHVNLKLSGVPWDLDDDKLVPGAGACATCPKRSMSNPALFAELTKKGENDTCFDPECFKKKQTAFVKRQVKTEKESGQLVQISEQTAYTKPKEGEKILKRGQWLPAKRGECESVQKALIVRGENAGGHEVVCTDLDCKVHKRHLQTAPRPTDPAKAKTAEEEEKKRRELNQKFKHHLFDQVRAKLDGPSRAVLLLIFENYLDVEGTWQHQGLVDLHEWKGKPEKVLRDKLTTLPIAKAWNLMAELILWRDAADEYEELGKFLPTAAAAYKLDIPKLSKAFEKANAAPGKVQTSAKGSSKPKGK